jgi:hypothetical protein
MTDRNRSFGAALAIVAVLIAVTDTRRDAGSLSNTPEAHEASS